MINTASFALEKLALDISNALTRSAQILQAGVDAGALFSVVPMEKAKNSSNRQAYICF